METHKSPSCERTGALARGPLLKMVSEAIRCSFDQVRVKDIFGVFHNCIPL